MAKANINVCDTCGAAVTSDRCDLCGTPVSNPNSFKEPPRTAEVDAPDIAEEHRSLSHEEETVGRKNKLACPTCGAANRGDARFCDQCGENLQDASGTREPKKLRQSTPKPPKTTSTNGTGEQPKPRIGLYVAVAIVAVIALYALSLVSSTPSTPTSPDRGASTTAASSGSSGGAYLPEDDALRASLERTKSAIEAATDPAQRQQLVKELVQSYAEAGRLDLAGREQEGLAAELNSAEAWAMAGNMHFDWMEGQSGTERVNAAQRAAKNYEKALELDPENLDVRTDLGVAYLNDPASPMLAIQNTNLVLQTDSNHVQANFNKGVMLAQIGRTQDAIRLFRKVTQLAKPGEPAHDRAQQVLSQLGAPELPIGTPQ